MTRRAVWPLAVLAVEAVLFSRYRSYGALWHFWLHALLGGALGFTVLTVVALARRQPVGGTAPWRAAAGGHLYSAMPDVLFVAAGVLHAWWMDVFALHMTAHFLPSPLLSLFAVFALALFGWAAVTTGRRGVAMGCIGCSVVLGAGLVALRTPPPSTLDEVRADPAIAFLCPLSTGEGTA